VKCRGCLGIHGKANVIARVDHGGEIICSVRSLAIAFMALLFNQPLGKRHPMQKRRRPSYLRRYLPFLVVGMTVVALYQFMVPDHILERIFGGHVGAAPSDAGLLASSRVRIERLEPEKWTSSDVGVWLNKEGFGHLRATFKRNQINGPALLSIDQRRLMRELAINDDSEVSRMLEAVRLLKHIAFQSHNWKAANSGGAPNIERPDDIKMVDLYLVGENMLGQEASRRTVRGALPPAATISIEGVLLLRDVVARASKSLKRPVRELVTQNGELIADISELPSKAYALFEDDFFVYPTEFPGFEQTVPLPSQGRWRPGITAEEYAVAIRQQPAASVKVTTLSTTPRVLEVDKFLSDAECDHIISLARDSMDRSTIAEAGTEAINGVGTARTSSTAWLTKSADLLVADIRERVADLVKVPMHLAEDMQVVHSIRAHAGRLLLIASRCCLISITCLGWRCRCCITQKTSTTGHTMTTLIPTFIEDSSPPQDRTASSPFSSTSPMLRRAVRRSHHPGTPTPEPQPRNTEILYMDLTESGAHETNLNSALKKATSTFYEYLNSALKKATSTFYEYLNSALKKATWPFTMRS
jgi:hypothetical protein